MHVHQPAKLHGLLGFKKTTAVGHRLETLCHTLAHWASCWHAAGLSKEEVLSEGLHVLVAFEQLVEFVHSHTPPGQTPVIVAHRGFNLVFRHVEQCLQRAAAAAAATVNQQPDSAIANSSTVGKEHTHSSWLPSWLFHDTVVMATCLYELLPEKSTLHEQLGASLAKSRRDLTTFNFDTMRFNEQRSALLEDRDTLSEGRWWTG